jgi:transcriptional regulator with XRE-family HTH domain
MASIKERLRDLRKLHKLTQKDIGDFLGISESAYGYYEQGRNEPSLKTIKKLANKFGVSPSYILGETKNPTIKDDDKEFNEFMNDPNLGLWFKELKDSPEDQVDELRKIWEIIKNREPGKKPSDNQN